jgi:translocon-associated protein subunit alpha
MDFSFYIQNFSTVAYNKVVKPNHEATLVYSFIPSDSFAGRPFGLNINLNYRDAVSNYFLLSSINFNISLALIVPVQLL